MNNNHLPPTDRAYELALFAIKLAFDNHKTITTPFINACAVLPEDAMQKQFPDGKTFAELLAEIKFDLAAYEHALAWMESIKGEPSD